MSKLILENRVAARYIGASEEITELYISSEVDMFSEEFSQQLYHQMKNLRKVVVDKKNKVFSSQNGVLYDIHKTKLLFYPRAKNLHSFIMPSSVEKIEENAFSDGKYFSKKLEDVILSPRLTQIPDFCFENMDVYSVSISEGVTSIGKKAFFNTNIVCPTLPATLRHLSTTAFHNCEKMHILNLKDDKFHLTESMLPKNNNLIVVIETIDEIEKSNYQGINIMNMVEFDKWIEEL